MKNTQLPNIFFALFKWLCKPELFEELQGDLEEAFEENKALYGPATARAIYRREVLRMIRPSVIRYFRLPYFFNHTVMFRNYFKVSFRSLMKNPLSSSINILGLSVAIGTCVFAYAFARWTYSTDQFHEHKNEVYLVTYLAERDGTMQQYGTTPRPLGEMLKQDFASVSNMCRVEDRPVVVKNGDKVFHEKLRFTDPSFLKMLTFPMKWGSSEALSELNSIILSEAMAEKYFGEENPVGRNLMILFGPGNGKSFTVGGVAEAFPEARTISFSFLTNILNLRQADPQFDFNSWSNQFQATLIQVKDAADLRSIEQNMEKYKLLQNASAKSDWEVSSFVFEPLASLHRQSEHIKDDISRSSADNYLTIIFLIILSGFMLALACFNYINMAVVTAAKRLKEIGIRKTIGATRGIVIIQFLVENVVVTAFALVLGMVLAMTVFIPGFEKMWHFSMGFSLSDPNLWVYLPAVLLFTAIVSGIYPAFYISRFEVVKIIKGSVILGKRSPLTKTLLCLQLIFSCIFITTSVMFSQNTTYLSERSWGYEKDAVLYAEIADYQSFAQLKTVMEQVPDVISTSGSAQHVGKRNGVSVVHVPGQQYEVDELSVDARYLETMGIRLKAGRTFNENHESDKYTLIVNEAMVKNMQLEDPVGQVVRIDSALYEIVGVAHDFHNFSFSSKVNPTIFRLADKEDYRYLSLKVQAGKQKAAFDALQQNWSVLFPEMPFQGGYQEDVWGFYFTEIGIYSRVWHVIAFIAILLATLGLYGLMALNVRGRIREFSIRKVLGAGLKSLAGTISSQYSLLFAIAILIGAPLGYLLSKALIESTYTYHMPFNYWGTVIAVIMMLFILSASVAMQVFKLQKFNPVNGLRVE